MHEIHCAEIWGGIRGEDVEAHTSTMNVSLFSSAADGGRGGDIYYVSRCQNDAITRVAIADVRGHGSAVGDIGCWLYEALRARMSDPDDAAVLADLNGLVAGRGLEAMTTAAIASFDRGSSKLRFAYAGHYPIYALLRRSEHWDSVTLEATAPGSNLPLGAFDTTSYDLGQLSLSIGDRLFLYTDGLIEAPSPIGEPFGLDRLVDTLGQGADLTVGELKAIVRNALCEHTAGNLAHDDVTFLVVEPRPLSRRLASDDVLPTGEVSTS